MSVPVGSDPLQACCSSQIKLGFLKTLNINSSPTSTVWVRIGDDMKPHQDSRPPTSEESSLTVFRTKRPLVALKLSSSLVPRLLNFKNCPIISKN